MPVTPMDDRDESLEALADHCLAARTLIEDVGTTAMRDLIDLLLYEVGHALAKATPIDQVAEYCD